MARGRKPILLLNDIREEFWEEWSNKEDPDTWPLWIDDIVSGVARLDWYSMREHQIPLSTTNIIRCFSTLEQISTASVMELLNIGKSQASLYVKACTLCYPFFKRSLSSPDVRSMRYRRQSIVSEEQGISLGYDRPNKALI